jgi:hypothetical protein
MAKHVLSLEVPDTLNNIILRIADTSIYSSDISIECPILNVTVPGFNYSVEYGEVEINSGFSLNLTACNLELQTTGCGTNFKALPDGIYIIKYSVSPNDVIYVEYNHLRVTKLLNIYYNVLCELDIAACDPDTEKAKKLDELSKIKMYIEAAKSKVEICHEPKKGMELYTYAKDLLDKFDCQSCQ